MKKLLFVNACVRGEQSRTLLLCRYVLKKLKDRYDISEVCLADEKIASLSADEVAKRIELVKQEDTDDDIFMYANALKKADYVVIGAPYWDLSFPSQLKCYVERTSVSGVTFGYSESGVLTGRCKASGMLYITTSGGFITPENYGFSYIKEIFKLFGIEKSQSVAAEGLDIIGTDIEKELDIARQKLDAICEELQRVATEIL